MQAHRGWKEMGEGEKESLCSWKKNQNAISLDAIEKTRFCLSRFSFLFKGHSNLKRTVFSSQAQAAIPQALLGKPLTDVRFTQWVVFIYVFLKSSILGESLSGKTSTSSTNSQ